MSHYIEPGSVHVYSPDKPAGPDSKLPLEILVRLQLWVTAEFSHLSSTLQTDSQGEQYLQVSRLSPHPVLVSQPSLRLVCRVRQDQGGLACSLHSYNSLVLREVEAALDSEESCEELKLLLAAMDCHTTSICKGIPEEKLITWADRKNLSQILIERFASKVVFRERSCSYVMLETDQADICRSCAMLLSTSSMDLLGDQELLCPLTECARTFRYQGALDKHVARHEQEDSHQLQQAKRMKVEEQEGSGVKMEMEGGGSDLSSEAGGRLQDESDFLDMLLSDLDTTVPAKRKKKKQKPTSKDFNCVDCGKAFYYQKNLFTHVVEKHGKSIHELPNLDDLKEDYEDDYLNTKKARRRVKGEKDKPVVCDECGVAFKFASGLYNHRKRMHGDTERKKCPHCEKEVKSCTLDQHIREEHGTPRFACQFCGKGFYYKSFMLNHQRLHTGDYKECVCDLCGAVYKSVQVLNRHVRNVHQDLRNHKCQHCDKAFHNKQRLERHINSQHTKARIWPCPVCNSRYDRKDNLRTHIRKNHANVVDVDTVELTAVDNEAGGEIADTPRRARPAAAALEPTINPETGELERAGAAVAREQLLLLDRCQSVHVAHDLLSLKYGEEGQYRTLALGQDIKPEVVQYSSGQLGAVKLERAEIVLAGPVLGLGAARRESRESSGEGVAFTYSHHQ